MTTVYSNGMVFILAFIALLIHQFVKECLSKLKITDAKPLKLD